MTEPDLFSVLDRATDRIGSADGPRHEAAAALAAARGIRNRRRGAAAAAVALVAVLVVVLATRGGLHRADPPIAPSPTVPEIRADAVQPTWDPKAGDLPRGRSALPEALDPPADPAPLPLAGPARAVLDAGERATLFLLGTDGSWATTQSPGGDVNSAALSADGTMLAAAGDGGLWVTDVREGTWRRLDLPQGWEPPSMWTGLGAVLLWDGDTRLLVRNMGTDIASLSVDGTQEPSASSYGTSQTFGLAVAPDGTRLVFGDVPGGKVIREVRDGRTTRSLDAGALERVSLPVATQDRVVGTVSGIPGVDPPTDHAGILVLDRNDDYAAEAYLPIARTRYEPGVGTAILGVDGVRPLAWLDDRTVLLQYAPTSLGRPWSLVTWDVESGDLARVAGGGRDTHLAAVASGLLAPAD